MIAYAVGDVALVAFGGQLGHPAPFEHLGQRRSRALATPRTDDPDQHVRRLVFPRRLPHGDVRFGPDGAITVSIPRGEAIALVGIAPSVGDVAFVALNGELGHPTPLEQVGQLRTGKDPIVGLGRTQQQQQRRGVVLAVDARRSRRSGRHGDHNSALPIPGCCRHQRRPCRSRW